MELTLVKLNERAKAARDKTNQRNLANYHYARGLGFSGSEAVILMSRKRDLIVKLAIEKGLIKSADEA